MDFGVILSTAVIITTGVGGWLQGRTAGTSTAFQVASDTVGMLSLQVAEYRQQIAEKEARIAELTASREAVEGHCQMCERRR